MLENIGTIIRTIVSSIGAILGLVVIFKTKFIRSDRVIKGKYQNFKILREEYLKDPINGYFAFQNYLGIRVKKEEIDYILASPDAYKIMSLIRGSSGRYEFDGKVFKAKIGKNKYILPMIGYSISGFPLLLFLSFMDNLVKAIGINSYLILFLFALCILGPILIISMMSINEISKMRYLEKISEEKNGKENDKKK